MIHKDHVVKTNLGVKGPQAAWAMHGKRQNVMHGPAGLTQTEKK